MGWNSSKSGEFLTTITALTTFPRETVPAHRLSGTDRITWRFRAEELDGVMMAAPSAAENGESFNATGK